MRMSKEDNHTEMEFKNPNDALTIDDFFKTFAYACLYKGLGKTVDAIPAREVTVMTDPPLPGVISSVPGT